jgi:hypothetical protein
VAVSLEQAVSSTIIQDEAIVRLLVRKGICTREEVVEEIKSVRDEMNAQSISPPGEAPTGIIKACID